MEIVTASIIYYFINSHTLITGVSEHHFTLSPSEMSYFSILVCYTRIRNCNNCYLNLLPSLYQQTPLHVAADKKHDYTVKCLVKKEAKINIRDKDGVRIM